MEGAQQIFSDREIHARLATDRGVYLRQKSSRNLDDVDTAHINGGQHAGHVADHAAAKRKDDRTAIGASFY